MNKAKKTVTRKVGTNRGNARIWLEGNILLKGGWNHADKYSCEFNDGSVVYRKKDDGERKVAGSPTRPIIDTNTSKLTVSLHGAEVVVVKVSAKTITLTPHVSN